MLAQEAQETRRSGPLPNMHGGKLSVQALLNSFAQARVHCVSESGSGKPSNDISGRELLLSTSAKLSNSTYLSESFLAHSGYHNIRKGCLYTTTTPKRMIGYRQLQIAYSGTHDFKKRRMEMAYARNPFLQASRAATSSTKPSRGFGLRQLENTYV
ncbi:hypothetical protein LZK76_36740 (plasmid) [Rhizobium leguminosarum]|nr:hypothetical protein LZK76_36740 [Rhizobium leguminosarum]